MRAKSELASSLQHDVTPRQLQPNFEECTPSPERGITGNSQCRRSVLLKQRLFGMYRDEINIWRKLGKI
jgi:hypothetical protein